VSDSGKRRLRLSDKFYWYSPGLDLNDVGYLRRADLMANEVWVGWAELSPKGAFRSYCSSSSGRTSGTSGASGRGRGGQVLN
jgi:hypothetical protein